jgi:cytochrome c5
MQHVMRVCVLILALTLAFVYEACDRAEFDTAAPVLSSLSANESAKSARVDFDTQVRPILESRCTPCHFKGGTM